MKKLLLILLIIVLNQLRIIAQTNINCSNASQFCSGVLYDFPLATNNGSGEVGPNYTCLYSQPNPTWFYLLVDQPGQIDIHIESTSGGYDIDFTCWGPFSTLASCGNLTASNTIDCSYSTSYAEDLNISNALTGQYYIFLVTNFSNSITNVSLVQTNAGQLGAASTICNDSLCVIDSINTLTSGCLSQNNQFNISGNIFLDTIPDSGSFIVTEQTSGISQVISPPYSNPINFIIDSVPYSAQNHVVNVFFSSSCQLSANYTPPVLATVQGESVNSNCGYSDGKAIINISSGGIPNYSYLWSTGQSQLNTTNTSDTLSGVSSGLYEVTVTNGNGCTSISSINVNDSNAAVLTPISNIQPLCYGDCNGSLIVSYNGTNPPFNYIWSNGQSHLGSTLLTDSIYNLCDGTYSVTVTDQNGCSTSISQIISQPAQLSINIVKIDETCYQFCNGTINSNVSGGQVPYSYLWSNLQNTQFVDSLCPGSYSVTATDFNGCTLSSLTTISGPPLLQLIIDTIINATCGISNGSATISIQGGTTGYTINWSTGGNSLTENNMPAGNHTVTISDQNGCTAVQQISIQNFTGPVITAITPTPVSCAGINDGTAIVSYFPSSAPAPPYVSTWSNSWVGDTANNLTGGNYWVTVTDANGCQTSGSVIIDEPTVLLTVINYVINNICNGSCDGVASILTGGGTQPYTWNWIGTGQITSTASNLCAGQYSVIATDAHSCTDMQSVIITEPQPQQAGFNYTSNELTVNYTNTSSLGSYIWDFGDSTTSVLTNPVHSYNTSGTYIVCLTVQDSCDTVTFCQNVTITLVNVNNVITDNIEIFPNPATDKLNIIFPEIPKTKVGIELFDNIGQKIAEYNLVNKINSIDLKGFAEGIYYIKVETSNVNILNKIIINKN